MPNQDKLLDMFGVVFRDMREGDEAFVMDSWIKSGFDPFVRGVDAWLGLSARDAKTAAEARRLIGVGQSRKSLALLRALYFKTAKHRVKTLIQAHPPVILCDREDPTFLVGYACGKFKTYVKLDFREPELIRALASRADGR